MNGIPGRCPGFPINTIHSLRGNIFTGTMLCSRILFIGALNSGIHVEANLVFLLCRCRMRNDTTWNGILRKIVENIQMESANRFD